MEVFARGACLLCLCGWWPWCSSHVCVRGVCAKQGSPRPTPTLASGRRSSGGRRASDARWALGPTTRRPGSGPTSKYILAPPSPPSLLFIYLFLYLKLVSLTLSYLRARALHRGRRYVCTFDVRQLLLLSCGHMAHAAFARHGGVQAWDVRCGMLPSCRPGTPHLVTMKAVVHTIHTFAVHSYI